MATLYELEPDIRDVIVEGQVDAHFYHWFLDCAGVGDDVRVFSVKDRVIVDDSTITEHGNLIGERGRVITVAQIVNDMAPDQRSGIFIADADYGPVGQDNFPRLNCLIYTDYGSLEIYAFNVRTIEKVLRVILRAPRALAASAVLAAMSDALRSLFYARLVMRCAPGGAPLVKKYAECCAVSNGVLVLDYESLLRNSFSSVRKAERDGWNEERLYKLYLDFIKEGASDDVRKEMSGHDVSALLIRYLKIAAPQVFREDRKGFEDRDTMERALMSSVEFVDVEREPLFVELVSRVV
ncbi:hypothetical protein [Streptomyces cahuitamycinicus]|uniref:hypothetical protein n=1 Tax=Streptomyces cahuitamycinicus TaxID=2070367 RepID=UPI0011AF95DB|nr:hypothetical protein [Streptomyces cahuitamycinicus]